MIACFFGGFNGLFYQVFFLGVVALNGVAASFVEVIGLNHEGAVGFAINGDLAFLRFVTGSLTLDGVIV